MDFRDEYSDALGNGLDADAAWSCAAEAADEQIRQLSTALDLACDRIADSDQTYEECTTADGWRDRFMAAAKKAADVQA